MNFFLFFKTQERIKAMLDNHTILEEFAKHIRRIIRHKPLWAIFKMIILICHNI